VIQKRDSGPLICLGALFRRAVIGRDTPDLLGKHRQLFRITLQQHPLDEHMEHLPLLSRQGPFRHICDPHLTFPFIAVVSNTVATGGA